MKNPTYRKTQQRDNLMWRQLIAMVRHPLSMVQWSSALVLLALALTPWPAHAQATYHVPGQISYQGFLTDANGIPLATNTPKNYVVTFQIYSAATGGTALWGENQTVTVTGGYFSVLLGQGSQISGSIPWSANLTNYFTGTTASQRYIGITVSSISPGEIQPRLQLLASPYSLLAENANSIVANNGSNVLVTAGPSIGINETPNGNDSLDVKGNVGIFGNSTLDFGQGLAGQSTNAGQIGYETLSGFALDIVGAGTTGNRKIKLWAEAATSTTGPLGIENDSPAAALDVNGGAFFSTASGGLAASGGRPGISLWYDTTDNTGQIQSYKPGTGNSNLALNASGGNVGIGNLSPQAKLHVTGSTYLDGYAGILGKNLFEFGRGVAGKQANAGEIGYQTFDGNLDIVGAGTAANNRSITMYAEGGTSFTGPISTSSSVTTGSVGAGGGVDTGDVFTLNGNGHYNNYRMYMRGNGDYNHWLSYDDTFGTDGPSLVGYTGGLLGHSVGGYDWDMLWNSSYIETRIPIGIGLVPSYSLDVNGSSRILGQLYVSGYYYSAFNGGGYEALLPGGVFGDAYFSSDERLKKNITTIPNAIDTLKKLRGVTFNWNDTGIQHLTRDIESKWKSASGKPEDDRKLWDEKKREKTKELEKTQIGFIAQEVEKVFPDWVKTDDKGFKQINMDRLSPFLVNAINEQQTRIENQQQRADEQDKKIAALEKEVASLHKQLSVREESDSKWETRLTALEESISKLAQAKHQASANDNGVSTIASLPLTH